MQVEPRYGHTRNLIRYSKILEKNSLIFRISGSNFQFLQCRTIQKFIRPHINWDNKINYNLTSQHFLYLIQHPNLLRYTSTTKNYKTKHASTSERFNSESENIGNFEINILQLNLSVNWWCHRCYCQPAISNETTKYFSANTCVTLLVYY